MSGKGCTHLAYLECTAETRLNRRRTPAVVHPDTHRLCVDKSDMLDAAHAFCKALYTPDPMDDDAIEESLSAMPTFKFLPPDTVSSPMAH